MAFRDVVGHRRLTGLLSRSIARGTLPPSLIFAGPAGVGKRLAAVATAQALNCTAGMGETATGVRQVSDPPVDACGKCAACMRIGRGVHADVLVVEPGDTGSIKIEQVRDVVERAAYRPFEGRKRVVVIDQADALVPAAQNALLKTLEEPPSASMFVLITSRPDMLLPTVRSRCPMLRFGSVGVTLEASAADLVEARETAVRVLLQAASGDDGRRLEGAKDLLTGIGGSAASDRQQLAVQLRAMASLIRDVAVIGTGADPSVLANPDVRPALERLTAYRGDRGVRAFAALDKALAALDRNAGTKLVADWVTVNI